MGKRFEQLANALAARVYAAEIGPATEVVLVFHWVDEQGREVKTIRESIEPSVAVKQFGSGDPAKVFAAQLHVGTIVDNLKRRVFDAPEGFVTLMGLPTPVMIRDIGVEISKP